MTPQAFEFEGGRIGPKLLMFGAIHGNETCGTIALARLKLELELGLLTLHRGMLTIVPVCNPAAYAAGRRYVRENLNRIFSRAIKPSHPEQDFADRLMDLIDGCDVLLDLHSYSRGQGPFITLDYPTEDNTALASAQGVGDWITGWPEIYADAPTLNAGDTTQYANQTGKACVLVECGQHGDPVAVDVAYTCIRRTLSFLDMMDAGAFSTAAVETRIAHLTRCVTHDRPGAFAQPWVNLQPVPAGTPLILYEDGSVMTATEPCIIVMPDPIAAPGAEWLYLAEPA